MTILSLVAVGRLAERHVHQAGHALPVEDVVAWLVDTLEVWDERAHAGVRLAVTIGRLVAVTDDAGRPCLRVPYELEEAA